MSGRANWIEEYASVGLIFGGTSAVIRAIRDDGSLPFALIVGALVGALTGALYGYWKLRRAARR